MNKKAFRQAISRKAIRMKVGGFRPLDTPYASWFGRVLLGQPDELWPLSNGKPMLPLCQINLQEFPFKPELVQDIAFITLFIDADTTPVSGNPNGAGWILRTYTSLEDLIPIVQPTFVSAIKPFQMAPEIIDADFPMLEDCPIALPASLEDDYDDLFPNTDGIKLGGWPTLIQGEIDWPPLNQHSTTPTFAFQIDSVEKAHWQWGDNGVAYFGRDSAIGQESEWTFSWQCY
ncbi:hypothetical protein GCM10028805_50020 [Spirosoma harenae]